MRRSAQERVELARYAQLPVAAIGADAELAAADAALARALRAAGHLLWAADPGLPDIAGTAAEDDADMFLCADQGPLEVGLSGSI